MTEPQPAPKARAHIPWPPLVEGRLIRRYQRFKADVRLAGGATVTAHCTNTGAMHTCSAPNRPVFLSTSDNPRRKLKYTWEMIDMPTSLVGVNTRIPNRLVALGITRNHIAGLGGYREVKPEITTGAKTRLDLLLKGAYRRDCFVEVKNCTLVEDGVARFPDAATARGARHLEELTRLVAAGNRGAMVYLIQRMDARQFRPADRIDPHYGAVLRRAVGRGVEVFAYDVVIDLEKIALGSPIPICI